MSSIQYMELEWWIVPVCLIPMVVVLIYILYKRWWMHRKAWKPYAATWEGINLDEPNTLEFYAIPKREFKPKMMLPEQPSTVNITRTYFGDLPRQERIKHCQKCYETNLKTGNTHLAEFWKQQLKEAQEERDN